MTALEARLWAKPSGAGVYTTQRLTLSKLWEGTRRTCQGLEPDPGNLAVRDFRGASRNVRHGETVNPPCNRKSRTGNPSPTASRARSLSQPSASFEARSAPRSYPTEPILALAATDKATRTFRLTQLSARRPRYPKRIDLLNLRVAGCG